MFDYGFENVADETLDRKWQRVELIFKKQGDRVDRLKRAIENSYNAPEQAAWYAALDDAIEQCEATQEYLYAIENELIERGAKGWVAS